MVRPYIPVIACAYCPSVLRTRGSLEIFHMPHDRFLVGLGKPVYILNRVAPLP